MTIIFLMAMTMVCIESLGRHQERPEILVPAIDELDHEERRDRRDRERQQRVLEELEGAGAVDLRGLQQLVRDRREELAEEQRAGRRGDRAGWRDPDRCRACSRSETILKVGKMRTSTGSISVMKMIQNAAMRNGKR